MVTGPAEYRRARRALAGLAFRLADGDREAAMGLLAVALEAVGDMERSACATLADAALNAAGGDKQLAAVMLRPVLEAIGAVPYQRAQPGYRFGAAG